MWCGLTTTSRTTTTEASTSQRGLFAIADHFLGAQLLGPRLAAPLTAEAPECQSTLPSGGRLDDLAPFGGMADEPVGEPVCVGGLSYFDRATAQSRRAPICPPIGQAVQGLKEPPDVDDPEPHTTRVR